MLQDKTISILVVDDRPENLVVMQGILESRYYIIDTADSGAQALGMMLRQDYALVLLDVQMPDMDGFETAEYMKKSEKTRHIPIIFVTAISYDKLSISKGYDVGAVDYLFKPVDPVILKSKVDVFVSLYRQKEIIRRQAALLEEKVQELLELKEANWKLENLSLVDALTEMPNRRNFNQYINIQWGNCAFSKNNLSVIMLDIDHFKAYNDHYGHLKGDECIIKIGHCIMNSLSRPLDLAFRYGGEEFVVLLPNTDVDGAKFIGEKIRANVEAMQIQHEFSDAAPVVTVSVGVSTTTPDYKFHFHHFIESADKAMYLAKNQGRNCVRYLEFDKK